MLRSCCLRRAAGRRGLHLSSWGVRALAQGMVHDRGRRHMLFNTCHIGVEAALLVRSQDSESPVRELVCSLHDPDPDNTPLLPLRPARTHIPHPQYLCTSPSGVVVQLLPHDADAGGVSAANLG